MSITLTAPRSWADIPARHMTYIYTVLSSGMPPERALTLILLRCLGIHIFHLTPQGYLCSVPNHKKALIQSEDIAAAIHDMQFIFQPNPAPTILPLRARTGLLGKAKEYPHIDDTLHGVPFASFLQLDNLYQSYLSNSSDTGILYDMLRIVYPTFAPSPHRRGCRTDMVHLTALLHWFSSVKALFSRQFPHLFTPAPATDGQPHVTSQQLIQSMDNQLLALTHGDITLEPTVLQSDTWRALTYLNDLARQASNLKQKP